MELTVEHKHHRDGPEDCFGCKIKGVTLTFTAGRETFHNTTIGEVEREVRAKHPNAERLR